MPGRNDWNLASLPPPLDRPRRMHDEHSPAGVWELPIVGFHFTEVWFSAQLFLIAHGPTRQHDLPSQPSMRTQIRLGGSFTYRAETVPCTNWTVRVPGQL